MTAAGPPSSRGPAEVARLLGRHPPTSPPAADAGGAVTIVLRPRGDDVEVLLIERAERVGDPASGHVALPGGHVDDGDGTLAAAALRELEEEVGLRATDLELPLRYVGLERAERFSLTVGVFASALRPDGTPPRPNSPLEVAHVFWMPRSLLYRPERVVRSTSHGDREVDAHVADGHVLWGFTRRLLLSFFDVPSEGRSRDQRPG